MQGDELMRADDEVLAFLKEGPNTPRTARDIFEELAPDGLTMASILSSLLSLKESDSIVSVETMAGILAWKPTP